MIDENETIHTCIEIHKNGRLIEIVRKTRIYFSRTEAPFRNRIQNLVEKFELLGQVDDLKNTNRAGSSKTAEIIAAIVESVEEKTGLFIPRLPLVLGIPKTSRHRILHKNLSS